jgi:S1-C subfamily serine protease
MIRLKLLLLYLLFTHGVQKTAKPSEKDLNASVLLHMKFKEHRHEGIDVPHLIECSGTYIEEQVILTAAHCFEFPNEKVWARGPNDIVGYPVHLVAWDKKKDLAILYTPFKHNYVKLGKMPKRGDYVLNIGSPYNFEFVTSEGIVCLTQFSDAEFGSKFLVTTAMANPGSSGGGAFDKHGRLIGVNTMIVGMFGWNGITLSVNVDTIRQFIEEVKKLSWGGQ